MGTDAGPGLSRWQGSTAGGDEAFGQSVRHGIIIKNYVNPEVGRYAPPSLRKASRFNVKGIRNLVTICTSHVERCNLTIRTFMKRFARLALGFSKKIDNLAAATALHVGFYNFCRVHRTLACTPAMAAGVIDTLWTMEDLYDAVMELQERERRAERYGMCNISSGNRLAVCSWYW